MIGRTKEFFRKIGNTVKVAPEAARELTLELNAATNAKEPKLGDYYGLNGLDKKLEQYVNYDDGFYVELGANDGVAQSNSYYFELERGWRGILIEPSPQNFLKCYNLRGQNNSVHCNACVSFDFQDKFVELTYANLMSTSIGLDTDLEDVDAHIVLAQQFLLPGETSFTFGALAAPLNKILEESKAPKLIDFLSLDVEGSEFEVLKGIDHDIYRFKFMLIECRHIERLKKFLLEWDYEFVDKLTTHDYLFQNKRGKA